MFKNNEYAANAGVVNGFPPAYSRHQHACLTLNMTDRLRLIQFPTTIIDIIRQTILTSWRQGIQKEKNYAGAYEFNFKGMPWYGQG
ncbi:unnamed protein product, partial [Adineta steineri]